MGSMPSLPSLPWWAQFQHAPVSWVWGNHARQHPGKTFQDSGLGQVSPWPGQAWGQGPRLWDALEHGGRPPPRHLLTASHPVCVQSLGGRMFLGPTLLAAFSFPPSALREVSLAFCLQFLSHCHSLKIYLGFLERYLVLLSFCPQDFVVPSIFRTHSSHVSPACPPIANTHQSRNSVIGMHCSHIWDFERVPLSLV